MRLPVNKDLQDIVVRQKVLGPDVATLFALLSVAPAVPEAGSDDDIHQKIKVAEQAFSDANADVQQAQGMSTRVQNLVALAARDAAEELQSLKGKIAPADNCDPEAAFETLDKLRADATANLAKWEKRIYVKVQNVKESLATTISGAQNAITALQDQIKALHDTHDTYEGEWTKINDLNRSRMRLRITMLEEKCRLAKPAEATSSEMHVDHDVSTLQAQIAALQVQLAEQVAKISLVTASTEAGISTVGNGAPNTTVVPMGGSTINDHNGNVPAMSFSEREARIAHAAIHVGVSEGSKGKGKGDGIQY
jgi:hypothetical protein